MWQTYGMGYVAGCQVGYKVSYQSLMDAHYGTHSRVLQYIGYKVSLRVIVVVNIHRALDKGNCFNVMANLYQVWLSLYLSLSHIGLEHKKYIHYNHKEFIY